MRYLLILLTAFIACSCGNTFYVVRHAEKAPPLAGMSVLEANNPPLSDSGAIRANDLKNCLISENIQHIFSTDFKRTRNTAEPLRQLTNSPLIIYNPKKDSTAAFIERLKAITKGNVLVVGHSNTIDDIANMLTGETVVPGDLKDSEYDNLYVIKRKGKKFVFKGEKYGAPNPH
ncbi:MAG: histidine phosphatase family protein [Chitinophagaceae bacterium]|nr:histidine phosphatase family protein [Chitinophagaceae bacterium]